LKPVKLPRITERELNTVQSWGVALCLEKNMVFEVGTTKVRDHSGFLIFLVGIYVTVLVVTIGVASKFVTVGPLVVNGATLVFPITFIFNDVFTEVYGYERSRKIIWVGLLAQAFAALSYWVVCVLPAPSFWNNQAAYETILGQSPRIAAASLCAYFFGEYANSV